MGGLEALVEAGVEVKTDTEDGRTIEVGLVPGIQQTMVQGKLVTVIDRGVGVLAIDKIMEVEMVTEEEVDAL